MATTSLFSTKASNTEGGNFEIPEAGSYPASCLGIIDLGTHADEYKGAIKERRKIMLCWELNETDSKGAPFIVAQSFTWTLGKDSNLRGVVNSWTTKVLAEGEDFDILSLLEKPCVIAITHDVSGKGKAFAKIASVSAPMRGMTKHEPITSPFVFHLSTVASASAELDIPKWVPYDFGKPVESVIKSSIEWGRLPGGKAPMADDDDIPY